MLRVPRIQEEVRVQAFYQSRPEPNTPYRQLVLKHDEAKGWRVCLYGGTKWGAKGNGTLLTEVLVKDLDAGQVEYTRMFRELRASGWKPETPFQTWD